jgi:Xaa-Pro aminopeptidase
MGSSRRLAHRRLSLQVSSCEEACEHSGNASTHVILPAAEMCLLAALCGKTALTTGMRRCESNHDLVPDSSHTHSHGTAHGVGSFLNVHEGPQGMGARIAYHDIPLKEGMVMSNGELWPVPYRSVIQ